METKTKRFTIEKVVMDICYDYQPEESQIMYDENNEGYPGANEIIEINSVLIGGQNCTEMLEPLIPRLEELLLIELKKSHENNF
jgi:hypothetical protein